jgi:putative glycerol-1-phosphate prenyltransferase
MKFDSFIKKLKGSKPMLAVLVDPDKFSAEVIRLSDKNNVSCFLVGGSELKSNNIAQTVKAIKRISKIPVILFPGDETQLTREADGLLLLSLLSGRNPEYLIEKHVRAAPLIQRLKLSHLPTAYLLLNGSAMSTTQKVTGTKPLTEERAVIFTSLAGEQLGFKAIYLEAGSGAKKSVPPSLIRKVKRMVSIPVIVGGGIDSGRKAKDLIAAGANMIVVGNALEKDSHLIIEIGNVFK